MQDCIDNCGYGHATQGAIKTLWGHLDKFAFECDIIDKMYSRFETQKIPSGIKVLKPDELDTIWYKPMDLSEYKKVHVIGDIHGCYTALKEYFDTNGGFKSDEYYIFTGDYIDRGI